MCSNVFDLICLLDSLDNSWRKSQITAARLVESMLYIGTNSGMVYKLSLHVSPPSHIKVNQLHGKLKIKDLFVASNIGRIVVLHNSRLVMLDMESLEVVPDVKNLRGVVSFYVDDRLDGLFIWTVHRGNVQLHRVTSSRFEQIRSINCESPINTLAVDFPCLCVGTSSNYLIINVESSMVLHLFPVESSTASNVVRVGDGLFLVNGPNSLGIFTKHDGVSDRPPIQYAEEVLSVAFIFPYVICLTPSGLHVYSIIDQKLKQSLPFSGGGFLVVEKKQVLLVSPNIIFSLIPVEHTKHVASLLEEGFVYDALSLAQNAVKPSMNSSEFESYYSHLKLRAAVIKFMEAKFQEADDLFRNSTVDVLQIIQMYDGLVPPELLPEISDLPRVSDIISSNGESIEVYWHFLLQFLLETDDYSNRRCVDCAVIILTLKLELDFKLKDLVERPPSCHVQDCRESFVSRGRYHYLALLMYHKNHIGDALEIWTKLEKCSFEDPLYPGLKVIADLVLTMDDSVSVLQFIKFVFSYDPHTSIKMYTNHIPPLELDPIERKSFVECLKSHPATLLIFYEYNVFKLRDEDQDFHTELCLMYLEKTIQAHKSTVNDFKDEDFDTARGRLRDFLLFSVNLRISDILIRLKSFDFLSYELCMLYGKVFLALLQIGDHWKALDIIVRDLGDYDGAEEYCRKFSTCSVNLYHVLFEMYIEIYRTDVTLSPLHSLFKNSGTKLELAKVLECLSDEMTYSFVAPLIVQTFHKDLSTHRSLTITKDLLKHKIVGMYKELNHLTSRPIIVNSDTVCSVCGQEIAQSVFIVMENGLICHRFCMK